MFELDAQSSESIAQWIQAFSNLAVLLLVYRQLTDMRRQMSQSDDQNRAERAWQFMHFYQQEVHLSSAASSWESFFSVHLRVFSLLNQLIRFQQVDERLLFGFLSNEFHQFVSRCVDRLGRERFSDEVSPRINFLIATWGAEQIIAVPPGEQPQQRLSHGGSDDAGT